ncbi:amino acid ABC transporter [Telmatospirillum siberiense]|uniref:Amino acid ABC transporter n=2 Tax=Telmatospirillum siberiense TaxID=382514 RepID=A0A2N3Q1Y0_9PROT|nr:amino acid ABC transporter [Telmatospirillum siberiense]
MFWLVLLGLGCFAQTAARADATLDKIKERGVLVVGVMLSGPPFGYIDPTTQEQRGVNIDLAKSLADHLGVRLETVPVTPPTRVAFLQQGKVSLLLANMQWTQDRSEILTFVPTPYDEVGGAAVVRKGSGIKEWANLKGKPVCVSQGSNFTKPLAEDYGAQVKGFPSQPESLLALKGGNCVAAVHDGAAVKLMVEDKKSEWGEYEIPIPNDLIPSPSVIWLRKGETDTQAALDAIVKEWHRTGWLIETAKKNRLPLSPLLNRLHEQFKAS